MELIRIEEENLDAFSPFLPEGIFEEDDQVLGVLSEDGFPMAAAVFSPVPYGVMLKWIFTDPEERRKGAGTLLLHDAMTLLKGRVPALTVSFDDELKDLEALLDYLGFTITKGDAVYSIPAAWLLNRPEIKRFSEKTYSDHLICLKDAPSKTQESLRLFLKDNGGEKLLTENIDPDFSFMTEDADQNVLGCLLSGKTEAGLVIELLLNTKPEALEQLFSGLAKKTWEEEENVMIRFVSSAPSVESLGDRMIAGKTSFKKQLKFAVAAMEG